MRERKSAEDRKAEILQAALEISFETGPDRLTTKMIAGKLGVTQPAIYKHYKNKDEIWQGVADRLCDLISANIVSSTRDPQVPEDCLRNLVLGHLRLVQNNPALPEIMVMRDKTAAQKASLFQIRQSMSEFREILVNVCDEARKKGRFRKDISATDGATLVVGTIQAMVLRLLLSRDPAILIREGERLLELQLSLFRELGGGN